MLHNRSRRLLNHVTPATLALVLLGTVSVQPQAQSVGGQVQQISESITALTNNIGIIGGFLVLFGMMLVVIGALVIHVFLDGRRRAKADETSRKDYQTALGENRAAVSEFSKISKGAVFTQHQSNLFSKQVVAQLESDRMTAKENFEALIKSLGERFASLEENQTKGMNLFGDRTTNAIGVQMTKIAQTVAEAQRKASEFFAEQHRLALLEVADKQNQAMKDIAETSANSKQEMSKFMVAALVEIGVLQLPQQSLEPKTPTGTLPPVTESPDADQSQGE
jgi:hypothetical protein